MSRITSTTAGRCRASSACPAGPAWWMDALRRSSVNSAPIVRSKPGWSAGRGASNDRPPAGGSPLPGGAAGTVAQSEETHMGTRVSVLMPAYNEADNLAELVPATVAVLERSGDPWEILVIDDGSTDGTRGVMGRAAQRPGPLHPAPTQLRQVGGAQRRSRPCERRDRRADGRRRPGRPRGDPAPAARARRRRSTSSPAGGPPATTASSSGTRRSSTTA